MTKTTKSTVFALAEEVPCRGCGAVMAEAHDNAYGVCSWCWTMIQQGAGGSVTSLDFSRWLARRLQKDVARLSETGMSGRCEAFKKWTYGQPGVQCASHATEWRDGHRVCGRHARSTHPQYVSDGPVNLYERFTEIVRELCQKDKLFAEAMRDAMSSLPGNADA